VCLFVLHCAVPHSACVDRYLDPPLTHIPTTQERLPEVPLLQTLSVLSGVS